MKRLPGVVYAAFAVAVLSLASLTACGSDNPYDLPEYQSGQASGAMGPGPESQAGDQSGENDPSGSGGGEKNATSSPTGSGPVPTASPLSSPASTAVTYTPADVAGEGAWVEKGKVKARTRQARGAVEAVVGYMAQRVQLSNTWQVDENGLAAVATGQAVSSARERALSQQAAGRRSTGRFVVNVSSVKVRGDLATVTGCHFDSTAEVDENGHVLVPPPGGVLISMKVKFAQGVWRVTSWPEKKVPACSGWQK
ncbi:hypothetical protein Kisp01_47120 [Kineosporia sp. NBRC 101677]|uniref:hypothetical protein n=1 Tax=Kineosporia sp. NBRC 101677 TaxID=3032197 RepID=UPI0024A1BBF0|nr:hypothetical protein [Kineosporia sp. NBRC 101677]GLY17698.1 hypothetical protein Kisp01_47120 [Kineosporia sp. NBRC 101677]